MDLPPSLSCIGENQLADPWLGKVIGDIRSGERVPGNSLAENFIYVGSPKISDRS